MTYQLYHDKENAPRLWLGWGALADTVWDGEQLERKSAGGRLIALRTGLSPSTGSNIVADGARRGWLEVKRTNSKGRAKRYRLTEKGREALMQAREDFLAWESEQADNGDRGGLRGES